ncbi:MAG: DinB family protein [Bacteroidota bacterium]
MKQIEKIVFQLENAFNGTPFYGDSIWHIIESIPFEKANNAINEGHSIAQVLSHMLVWRDFVSRKIQGDDTYDVVLGGTVDWPEVTIQSESEWIALKQRFSHSQAEIISLLEGKDDDWLREKIPGRRYSFNALIKGIIQHDIYHIGQVNLLKNG